MSLGSNPLGYLGTPDANTNVKGKVRLATITETTTGTRTDLACTPAGVAAVAIAGAPSASTTQAGIIEISTNAEAAAKTEGNKAVVPSNIPTIMASPGSIGGTTPGSGAFTTLSASGAFSLSGDQVQVSEGGTGAASLTDHGILLGSGTAAVSAMSVGTNNQILIGQSGADPIWSDNVDIPGTLDVTGVSTFDDNVTMAGDLTLSGSLDITDDITIADGVNVVLDTTVGTKFGTATTQKIGFLNATPVAQQGNTADIKDSLVAFGFIANGGATPLNLDGGQIGSGTITLTDGSNIVVNSTTGSKIGTATTQKIGFYNATPIVQPANTTDIKLAMVNLGLLASGGATPLDTDGGAITGGNLIAGSAGNGLQIKEGSNARMGQSTLVAGTVTVSNTSVGANTRIIISRQSANSSTAFGELCVGTVVNGTSFVINSLDPSDASSAVVGDTSIVNWVLIESAA